jgi:hypothetical protein
LKPPIIIIIVIVIIIIMTMNIFGRNVSHFRLTVALAAFSSAAFCLAALA